MKGRESELGWNVQTQADGHITNLAAWDAYKIQDWGLMNLFSHILAWKRWCRGEVFTVGVRGPCSWERCVPRVFLLWKSLIGIYRKKSEYFVTLNKLFALTSASVFQLRLMRCFSEKCCRTKTLQWLFSDTASSDTGEAWVLLAVECCCGIFVRVSLLPS